MRIISESIMKTALLAVFLLPCAANAETVDFVMTGTGRNCSTCYNWSNDTYTLTVVTDNAVSSLANQSWTAPRTFRKSL